MIRLAPLLLVASVGTAHAGRVVGVLDIRGEGVNEVTLHRFEEGLEEGLGGDDELTLAPQVRMKEQLAASEWSMACLAGPCLKEVKAQTGAEWVITAGLIGEGESYRYTITLLDTATGRVLNQKSETCAACTVDDVASQATITTLALIGDDFAEEEAPAGPKASAKSGRGHARTLRRASILVLGVAALAAGAGAYFTHEDDKDVGYPLLGLAGGLAASGTLMLGLSFRF